LFRQFRVIRPRLLPKCFPYHAIALCERLQAIEISGAPKGNRTPVFAVKGRSSEQEFC
jgi:hypothetical protein